MVCLQQSTCLIRLLISFLRSVKFLCQDEFRDCRPDTEGKGRVSKTPSRLIQDGDREIIQTKRHRISDYETFDGMLHVNFVQTNHVSAVPLDCYFVSVLKLKLHKLSSSHCFMGMNIPSPDSCSLVTCVHYLCKQSPDNKVGTPWEQ